MILAYCGIVCICTYIGYSFSRNYILKYKIYNQLYSFLQFYKLEVSYMQKRYYDIVEKFLNEQKKDLIGLGKLKEFLQKDYYDEYSFSNDNSIKELDEIDNKEIERIFNELGKYDLMQEKEKIESFIQLVYEKLEVLKRERDKYANLSIKIGVIIGCLVVIMLL